MEDSAGPSHIVQHHINFRLQILSSSHSLAAGFIFLSGLFLTPACGGELLRNILQTLGSLTGAQGMIPEHWPLIFLPVFQVGITTSYKSV